RLPLAARRPRAYTPALTDIRRPIWQAQLI
ncbi:MAG: hypothetical protein ACI86S_001546, partial [Paracoccaceae bacterium]